MKVILALLMAGIMMAAMIAPAMSDSAASSATVGDLDPVIQSLDAPFTDITLDPGATATTTNTTVTVTLYDANGDSDLKDSYTAKIFDETDSLIGTAITVDVVAATQNGDQTAQYTGTGGAIPYSTPKTTGSKIYRVEIYDGATEIDPSTADVSVSIAETKSLSLTQDKIYFGTVAVNSNDNLQIDDPSTSPADESTVAAWNDGNIANTPTVGTPTNLTGQTQSPPDTIPGSGLTAGDDTFASVNPAGSDTANFVLDVPSGILADSYAGTVSITAV